MHELEPSLQQFGEFLLKAQLVTDTVAPTSCDGCGSFCRVRRWTGEAELDTKGTTTALQDRSRLVAKERAIRSD
ncbi:MAG: hypothetical protein Q7V01_00745 [Vicinamibacterales bacterium]|nr:hypothetical protein [Vicinamibacterales bacterium]